MKYFPTICVLASLAWLSLSACADSSQGVLRGGASAPREPVASPAEPAVVSEDGMASSTREAINMPADGSVGPIGDEDFMVRFDAPGSAIPHGLITGLNDLNNAEAGVWKAWGEAMQPKDSVVRLWIKYYLTRGANDALIQAALRAKAQGLKVFLTVWGAPEDRGRIKGLSEAAKLNPPSDVKAWCRQVKADVDKLTAAGVEVAYIEIWNEPDMPETWNGTAESFATFMAEAGKELRRILPSGIKIGGPGIASGWGNGMDWLNAIAVASKRTGFKPDFLSWHHYGSFPTDSEVFQTARRILDMARAADLPLPEPILSEWNVALPKPANMALDDHRGAVFYVALTSGLLHTPTTHSLFFFLQDGNWDTKENYAGGSVGIYTLAGGPKAVLSGMRLMRELADQPLVPRERWQAPMNLTIAATRDGDAGHLVVSNFPGNLEKGIRKFLDWKGMDLALLKGKDRQVANYMRGKAKVDSLRLPRQWEPVMEEAKAQMEVLTREAKQRDRWVDIRLQGRPKAIAKVRVIDEKHGNPIADPSFKKAFAPYRKGLNQAAMAEAVQSLRDQGVAASEVAKVEEAMKRKDQQLRGVSNQVRAQARSAMQAALERLGAEVPQTLSKHPATFAATVETASWATLDGDILRVRVPPATAVMVDLVW